MKIKKDFVTNSSSTSFMIIKSKDSKDYLDNFIEKNRDKILNLVSWMEKSESHREFLSDVLAFKIENYNEDELLEMCRRFLDRRLSEICIKQFKDICFGNIMNYSDEMEDFFSYILETIPDWEDDNLMITAEDF